MQKRTAQTGIVITLENNMNFAFMFVCIISAALKSSLLNGNLILSSALIFHVMNHSPILLHYVAFVLFVDYLYYLSFFFFDQKLKLFFFGDILIWLSVFPLLNCLHVFHFAN